VLGEKITRAGRGLRKKSQRDSKKVSTRARKKERETNWVPVNITNNFATGEKTDGKPEVGLLQGPGIRNKT